MLPDLVQKPAVVTPNLLSDSPRPGKGRCGQCGQEFWVVVWWDSPPIGTVIPEMVYVGAWPSRAVLETGPMEECRRWISKSQVTPVAWYWQCANWTHGFRVFGCRFGLFRSQVRRRRIGECSRSFPFRSGARAGGVGDRLSIQARPALANGFSEDIVVVRDGMQILASRIAWPAGVYHSSDTTSPFALMVSL